MELNTPLSHLPGIGPAFIKKLTKLELYTIEDLIQHYPFRYEDYSKIVPINMAKVEEEVTFQGDVWSIKNSYTKFHKVITKAIINDGTGSLEIVWFYQPWLTKNIKAGDRLQVSGKVARYNSKISLISPEWEKVDKDKTHTGIHTGRLVPVYPETAGISSKWLRAKLSKILPQILPHLEDPLPESLQEEMFTLQKSLEQIHFPDNHKQAQQARQKLSFDELFYLHLVGQKRKHEWQEKKIIKPQKIDQEKLNIFIKTLPFELTSAQKKVIQEIVTDLKNNRPMNRLVQGDVGSGKTVVAAAIIYLTYLNGLKSILMAPTEILAFQHHQTLSKLLSPFGIDIGIYTGSKKFIKNNESGIMNKAKSLSFGNKEKSNLKSSFINHNSFPNVIVGTHALLSDKLTLEDVGLVVVDEQQRFGVEQRGLLRNKTKLPHFLTMTATPIPRTVALTVYGDLDLSTINELPLGRKVVRTHFVSNKKRTDAYKFIAQHIEQGEQVYIITPLIEESETLASAKAAKTEYEHLQKEVFPKLHLGLLHGKMKPKEKVEVLQKFKNHELDILVSTSVVEVGVDIPNATIMVIEGAERFGLAQLHQLRGRVGRGEKQSFTFLFTETETSGIVARLKTLETVYDGLKLAELDLKIRGGGEIFGIRQSGRWSLKIASLSDISLVEKTKQAAAFTLKESPNLDKYPKLKRKLEGLGKEVMPD